MNQLDMEDLIHEAMGPVRYQKNEVQHFFESFQRVVHTALLKGENKIKLKGIGTLTITKQKARMARNPKTGEAVPSPEKLKLKFRLGSEMRGTLNQRFAELGK